MGQALPSQGHVGTVAALQFPHEPLLKSDTVRKETPTAHLHLPSDPLLVNPKVHMYTALIPKRISEPGENLELLVKYFGY